MCDPQPDAENVLAAVCTEATRTSAVEPVMIEAMEVATDEFCTAKASLANSADQQQVCERIEQIVNDQIECDERIEQTNQMCTEQNSESLCQPAQHADAQSDDVQMSAETSGCQSRMDQNVEIQYPSYNFGNMFELLNSGSLFSAEQYLDSCKWYGVYLINNPPPSFCMNSLLVQDESSLLNFSVNLPRKQEQLLLVAEQKPV